MAKPLMTFEEVRALLKQRFPMLMVDSVISLEPGKSIRTTKNVTGNEMQFLGHFPEHAVMPGTLIVEAIGQSASILFAKSRGTASREFLVLGSINDTRFLVPVVPGDQLQIDSDMAKFPWNTLPSCMIRFCRSRVSLRIDPMRGQRYSPAALDGSVTSSKSA